MKNCIVIPTYKTVPNEWEVISLTQCFKILNRYDMYIVTYQSIDLDFYRNLAQQFNVELNVKYFDEIYFKNITGYNFLMLNRSFYSSFSDYDYLLIYQLDCFVFKDELNYWAAKGYDYIGSPWFADYGDYAQNKPFWYNGNGGFSIRRIKSFLRVFDWKGPLRKMPQIKHDLRNLDINKYKKEILYCFIWLGYHNTISNFWKKMGYDQAKITETFTDGQLRANEDVLWTNMFKYARVVIKTPDFEGGLGFSYERSPQYLFEKNNNILPFGCHAWWKYDLEFWKPYITKFGYEIPLKED